MADAPDRFEHALRPGELLREDLRESGEVEIDVGWDRHFEVWISDRVERIESVELDGVENAKRLEHRLRPPPIVQTVEGVQCHLEPVVLLAEEVRIAPGLGVPLQDDHVVASRLEVPGSGQSAKPRADDGYISFDDFAHALDAMAIVPSRRHPTRDHDR